MALRRVSCVTVSVCVYGGAGNLNALYLVVSISLFYLILFHCSLVSKAFLALFL